MDQQRDKRKKKSQTNLGLLGQQKEMHAGQPENRETRDETPTISLKAVFLIKHQELSSKELRNWAEEWDWIFV